MRSIIAPNIKRIMKQRCLKQCAVAERAGYSDQQFSAMLNGRKTIKDTDIPNIAFALNVDANELFLNGEQVETKN